MKLAKVMLLFVLGALAIENSVLAYVFIAPGLRNGLQVIGAISTTGVAVGSLLQIVAIARSARQKHGRNRRLFPDERKTTATLPSRQPR